MVLVHIESQQWIAASGECDTSGELHAERLQLAALRRGCPMADSMNEPHSPSPPRISRCDELIWRAASMTISRVAAPVPLGPYGMSARHAFVNA